MKKDAPGVKSKHFGCFWKSMFMVAVNYPNNPKSIAGKKHIKCMKRYIAATCASIPCKFCQEYCQNVLAKEVPLQFTSRRALMFSLYVWKDMVNRKLMAQERQMPKHLRITKRSPPFHVIYNRYIKMEAKCDPKVGKCL